MQEGFRKKNTLVAGLSQKTYLPTHGWSIKGCSNQCVIDFLRVVEYNERATKFQFNGEFLSLHLWRRGTAPAVDEENDKNILNGQMPNFSLLYKVISYPFSSSVTPYGRATFPKGEGLPRPVPTHRQTEI